MQHQEGLLWYVVESVPLSSLHQNVKHFMALDLGVILGRGGGQLFKGLARRYVRMDRDIF